MLLLASALLLAGPAAPDTVDLQPVHGDEPGVASAGVDRARFAELTHALRARYPDLEVAPAASVRAIASSHGTWRGKKYLPSNVLDRDFRTAWVEGRDGHGVGEWIALVHQAHSQVTLRGLLILAGFAKNRTTYSRNSRPRRLCVDIQCANEGGHPTLHTYRLHLDDARRPQAFLFDPPVRSSGQACTLRVTVEAVYPGTHYRDTSVAELCLLLSR
jgi:hypothetical protein